MAVKWTEEQQRVITLRDANILVSAAAGSGKTAVLVERIINKIMDEAHPVHIDQFVIVTFTKAAAGEMRDRIQAAIEKEASLHPENEHLQRQRTRIHMANISTIDSFCSNIIRNHYQEIDLDPSFRIGDTGELNLLKKDVLGQVLEEYYEEGSEAFHHFVETFSTGKDDEKIEELILNLYTFSMSFPYPEKWLDQCEKDYGIETYEELMESSWMKTVFQHLKQMMDYIQEKALRLRELVYDNEEAQYYRGIADFYQENLHKLQREYDYETWYEVLSNMQHPNLPKGSQNCKNVPLREEINATRNALKKIFEDLTADYFMQSSQEVLEDMKNCRPVIETLVQVTKSFMECFQEEKGRKNILDYSDLEHKALEILLDEQGNPTDTAKEYGQFFEEILIDEYQDSNLIQEYLLTAVSKISFGENNLFMVGDAKQSIYRFRLARPELFMEKFNRYSTVEGVNRRIDLHKNFRSRADVLNSANYIFGRIMKPFLGEIDYNEDAALYHGMDYPAPVREEDYTTELLVFDKKDLEVDAKEYEAKLIAHRIKQLVSESNGLNIVDKRSGQYRRARYSDIAILIRSTGGFDSILAEELAAEGIPAHMISKEGYFDTLEIVTMLNYLRIIDNPMQDIPLLSVLKSPLVGLTDEELATIRVFHGEDCLFYSVKAYAEEGEQESLQKKMCKFLEQLQQFRQKMYYMPVHGFICHILDVTGYGDYIGVMPGGAQRKANMDMLIEKAAAFEQTSYTGVFQFIRYIEQLQKYKVEMGEASILNENDNTVRIMTIHKSKGLEFPVVFVAGLGRQFNRKEESKPLGLHVSMGIGMDSLFLDSRLKRKTLSKKSIALQNRLETLGEELRVLYVALTRAKEKLILTGGMSNMESAVQDAYLEGYQSELAYGTLIHGGSYLDWILKALICHRDLREFLADYVEEIKVPVNYTFFEEAVFGIKEITLEHMMEEDLMEIAKEERLELELDLQKNQVVKELPKQVLEALEYVYPHEEQKAIPVKVSVSELKHAGMILEEEERQLIEEKEKEPIYPVFMKEKEEQVSATDRGTAYHTVFECLDLGTADTRQQVEEQLERLYREGRLEDSMRAVIKPGKIHNFAVSAIGKRMKKAQQEGKVRKEQPFVFALPAKELEKSWDSNESVMIQGIIDVYFEEDGELVLLDYKTDYLKSGKASELVDKYKTQMDYYKLALEAITKKTVKETILYSVYLDQEINL